MSPAIWQHSMPMPPRPEVAAVVMAGGKSSRLGELCNGRPKCLLSLPEGETLLGRLLTQLRLANIGKALICCSRENVASIDLFLNSYRAEAGLSEKEIVAVGCAHCRAGPVPALAEALEKVAAPWYLLCLADILFTDQPFSNALNRLAVQTGPNPVRPVQRRDAKEDACEPKGRELSLGPPSMRGDENNSVTGLLDGLLITGMDQARAQSAGSGFLECLQRKVRAISYNPFPARVSPSNGYHRWAGAFLFRQELILGRSRDLFKHGAAPFEVWIQELLGLGARCEWTDGGRFFNINCRTDYDAVLASYLPPAQEEPNAKHAHARSGLG